MSDRLRRIRHISPIRYQQEGTDKGHSLHL